MRSTLLLLASALPALCFPAGGHVLHERRDTPVDPGTKATRLPGDEVLPVRISLAQSNLDRGHDLLMQVSNPFSHNYGQHLSTQEVHDLFAPTDESVTEVRAWLQSEGIDASRISQSKDRQWLRFDATANELERLLRAEYYLHEDEASGKAHVSTREYHLPSAVQRHIDYVEPGIGRLKAVRRSPKMPKKASLQKRQNSSDIILGSDVLLSELLKDPLSFCDRVITPQCIRAMYNIPLGTTAIPGNEIGIFEQFPQDVYAQGDLDLAWSTVATEVPLGTHPILKGINGATAPTTLEEGGPESANNFQLSFPIIHPQGAVLFAVKLPDNVDLVPGHAYFDYFLEAINGDFCDDETVGDCGVYEPTNVISMSWGWPEFWYTLRRARRQCHQWMKLGLQGVTVVVSSGDSGVTANLDKTCLGPNADIFAPGLLTSCPYITSVGATMLPTGADPFNPQEVAVFDYYEGDSRNITSGGGFSNIWKRPAWQASLVEEYFSRASLALPYYETVNNESFAADGGVYNRIGRGYPDVSAVGNNILWFVRGGAGIGGGTSSSTPVFASMLTRINEERLVAGKPTVGFVNPVLYVHPEAFRDITEGYNEGCGEGGAGGFPAIEGWDPVTGLGTPVFDKLLEVFMNV